MRENTSTLLPLQDYDVIIAAYSGGKDSLACILDLIERGAPKERIELWHQDVDGGDDNGLMDWPVTHAYVETTGKALGIPTLFQWRRGGFEAEMLRNNQPTGPVVCQQRDGTLVQLDTKRATSGTREKFPQVSGDLSVRWCSAYLKIDVAARAISNDPRFKDKNILVVTGERRQESTNRAKYAGIERHRCSNSTRRVDQWRPIIDWSEEEVWAIIERHRINPHPAYHLGFGRVSCMACIFGDPDQWATVKQLDPKRFDRIAEYEELFGVTIKKGISVRQQAEKGTVHAETTKQDVVAAAMATSYPMERFFVPKDTAWKLPAGAYKRCGGPI
jgi:3'-phosphoadenosine 5'-phosphosulfate sulfotransferase (PAPS reductase)/FAD synthetase